MHNERDVSLASGGKLYIILLLFFLYTSSEFARDRIYVLHNVSVHMCLALFFYILIARSSQILFFIHYT